MGLGTGDVLQQIGLPGKLHDEGLIAVRGPVQHIVQKGGTGSAFVVERVALAHAGVHQQTEGQRNVGIEIEVADRLGLAVDRQGEVVLGEVLDQGASLVAHDDGNIDQARVDVEGLRCGRGRLLCASDEAGISDGQEQQGRGGERQVSRLDTHI